MPRAGSKLGIGRKRMKPAEFEARMRQLGHFHGIRLIPGAWPIIRVDGRSFSRFTESRFEKPFDPAFRDLMIRAAETLLRELQGIYAYTESDEISLLLPRDWNLFDRELEKAVSISASVASSAFSLACGSAAHFDSRICLAVDAD